MAGKIIWSSNAQRDRFNIMDYWLERNKSKENPRQLPKMFADQKHDLIASPQTAQETSNSDIRWIVIRDYKVFFEKKGDNINNLRIWDGRRDPNAEPF